MTKQNQTEQQATRSLMEPKVVKVAQQSPTEPNLAKRSQTRPKGAKWEQMFLIGSNVVWQGKTGPSMAKQNQRLSIFLIGYLVIPYPIPLIFYLLSSPNKINIFFIDQNYVRN